MGLQRNMSVGQGIILAIGMVLGSGLFALPGLAIGIGGADTALLAWLLMAVIMAPMLYVFIVLGRAFPQADGLTQYAQAALAGEALNSAKGRMAKGAVTVLLSGTFVVGIPASLWVAASYVLQAFDFNHQWARAALTTLFLLFSILMNLRGVTMLARVNAVSLYVLLAVMGLLIFGNLSALGTALQHMPQWRSGDFSLTSLWAVMALLFWAFLGWENMSFGLGELKDPKRSVPLVYVGSFVCVVVLYLTLAAVTSGAALQGQNVAHESGLLMLFHAPWLKFAVGIVMALMMVSSQNAWIFGASRMLYSASNDGFFPARLAQLNDAKMPAYALWTLFFTGTASLFLLTAQILSVAQLMTLVSQNFLVLYAVSLLAYWRIVVRSPKPFSIVMGCVASGSCIFMLQGFTLWLLYPIGLLLVGAWLAQRTKERGSE